MKEKVLYAVKDGDEDWQEQIITTYPDRFSDAREWAQANGFGRFRIAEIDLSQKPDFARCIRKR